MYNIAFRSVLYFHNRCHTCRSSRTNEVAILQVVELGRYGLAAWTTALEALIVIEDLVGEFLVRLARRKDLLALEAFGRRLGIACFADKGAVLFFKELLAADGLVAFDAA